MALDATRWIRSGKDAEIHANKVGGWGVYAIQELSAGDEMDGLFEVKGDLEGQRPSQGQGVRRHEIVPGKGKQKRKEVKKEVLPVKHTTEQAHVGPPKMRKDQAGMLTSPSLSSVFAKLSLTSPILRTEETHDILLTSPVLRRPRYKSPYSTPEAPSVEPFEVMAVDSLLMAASSSDALMSETPPRPRKSTKTVATSVACSY
ncbi:hypothetical protein ARMGADRAFT_1026228 [Armillaria gallica]|uniref:Uncharacterized protein n=1 Tax=Armillaria gallica TaxID=47427 RepID=A0A2H3DVN6_ARMGA|nr:hypothetical protein ARMGADRAFT_1026228 [Armillaria gallica]